MSYRGFDVDRLFSAQQNIEEAVPVEVMMPEEVISEKPEYFSETIAAKPIVQARVATAGKPTVRVEPDTEQLTPIENDDSLQGGEGSPEIHRSGAWRGRAIKYGAVIVGTGVFVLEASSVGGYMARQGYEDSKPFGEDSGMTVGERISDGFDRTIDLNVRKVNQVLGNKGE